MYALTPRHDQADDAGVLCKYRGGPGHPEP